MTMIITLISLLAYLVLSTVESCPYKDYIHLLSTDSPLIFYPKSPYFDDFRLAYLKMWTCDNHCMQAPHPIAGNGCHSSCLVKNFCLPACKYIFYNDEDNAARCESYCLKLTPQPAETLGGNTGLGKDGIPSESDSSHKPPGPNPGSTDENPNENPDENLIENPDESNVDDPVPDHPNNETPTENTDDTNSDSPSEESPTNDSPSSETESENDPSNEEQPSTESPNDSSDSENQTPEPPPNNSSDTSTDEPDIVDSTGESDSKTGTRNENLDEEGIEYSSSTDVFSNLQSSATKSTTSFFLLLTLSIIYIFLF